MGGEEEARGGRDWERVPLERGSEGLLVTQSSSKDTGLMWGGLAQGWGPAMGTVPPRQPGDHELREGVSQEEGMRRTL